MKPRASFAWRRLRRLEFGLDSCSTFGAVDWYLKATYLACPPFGAEWRNGTVVYRRSGSKSLAQLSGSRGIARACMML
jgi:hypothetical protein